MHWFDIDKVKPELANILYKDPSLVSGPLETFEVGGRITISILSILYLELVCILKEFGCELQLII